MALLGPKTKQKQHKEPQIRILGPKRIPERTPKVPTWQGEEPQIVTVKASYECSTRVSPQEHPNIHDATLNWAEAFEMSTESTC